MSASRPFIDSFGFSWQAWEIGSADGSSASAAEPGGEECGRLYFFSRGTTRVLARYPADWYRASWAELEDLCARASILGADLAVQVTRHDAVRAIPPGLPATIA